MARLVFRPGRNRRVSAVFRAARTEPSLRDDERARLVSGGARGRRDRSARGRLRYARQRVGRPEGRRRVVRRDRGGATPRPRPGRRSSSGDGSAGGEIDTQEAEDTDGARAEAKAQPPERHVVGELVKGSEKVPRREGS